MKLLGMLIVLALAGCAGSASRQQSLAQCQMEVLGSKGSIFRKNYAEGEFAPSGKDGSYREFMLTCMEAEGYQFAPPFDDKGENKKCWLEDKKGLLPDAIVDAPTCYTRNWW